MNNTKELTAIDVNTPYVASSGTAYIRISKELKEFLNKCYEEYGIVGFEYEYNSFNFGVILGEKINLKLKKNDKKD